MEKIEIEIKENGQGALFIEQGDKRIAEMVISVALNNITVFHTSISEELRGQGISKKLLDTLVEYARKNNSKIIPLCPFVSTQFNQKPDQFEDVWNRNWHSQKH